MDEKNKMQKLAGLDDKELSIIEIISKYELLSKALKYIISNSTSNYAPYHNLNHLLTVTKHVYYGLKTEGILDGKNGMLSLISAMFHDFNHSEGKNKDDKNVADAKEGVRKFADANSITNLDLEFIDKMLDATQYPYIIENKELNKYQAIIRDADIMQLLEYNWLQQTILGLSKELGMSVEEFMKGQKKFMDSVEFISDYGKKMKKEKWPQIVKEVEALENILKS
jgi:hypothetical protein